MRVVSSATWTSGEPVSPSTRGVLGDDLLLGGGVERHALSSGLRCELRPVWVTGGSRRLTPWDGSEPGYQPSRPAAESAPVRGPFRAVRARRTVGVVGRRRVAGGVEPARSRPASRCRPAAAEVVVELLDGAGAEDHRGDRRAVDAARPARPAPSTRRAPRRPPGRRRRRPRCARWRSAGRRPRRRGRGSRRAGWRRSGAARGVYLPVSQPPPSGDQGSSPSPVVQAGGHDLPLDLADQQVVLRLQGDRPGRAPAARRCRRPSAPASR